MWWTKEQEQEIAQWILGLCKTKKLVGHNILYDVLVLYYNWGYNVTDCIYSDTILQKHTVNEERPFALKEIAVQYLGPWADKAQKALYDNITINGGKTLKDDVEMWRADTAVLGEYCVWDVLLTLKLFWIFEAQLKDQKLEGLFYNEEIMPLYKEVTIPMKLRGFNIDTQHFEKLNVDIINEIVKLHEKIQDAIVTDVQPFIDNLLNQECPASNKGLFPKIAATLVGLSLPEKNGKITLGRKEVDKMQASCLPVFNNLIGFIKGETALDSRLLRDTQRYWYSAGQPEAHIFNLNSNNHLKWLFFTCYGETPLSETEGGEPQVDEEFLDSVKDLYPWVKMFIDYKKLSKLQSVYIKGVLDRAINGVIYSSFIQFGPPSGRYASSNPNLQNLPSLKGDDSDLSPLVIKYVNSIKKGFIAPEGCKIVNADYSQLEPRAFAEASGDKLLQQVFINNEDLYGSIACRVFNLSCKPNEVKKYFPEDRQQAKRFALATVYGAEAGRISGLMNISYQEAQSIINDYFEAYPGLKNYMKECNRQVCSTGVIKTKFGRIRHLPAAKALYDKYGMKLLDKKWAKEQGLEDTRWKFKNMLNLAKNYPIQGVAAHVVNRSMIAMAKEFKKLNLDVSFVAQVHDEITVICKSAIAEKVKSIVKYCMENTIKLSLPLKAEPLIADNWAEAK